MSFCKSVALFGSPEARKYALGLLENHPGIRRIDAQNNNTNLKLFMFAELSNMELLKLMADSGINGMQFF